MNLSSKTQYACLAMLELAQHHSLGEPVQVRRIAERHGIPAQFLVQIFQDLKRAGLVTSVRGAAGGYLLSRIPRRSASRNFWMWWKARTTARVVRPANRPSRRCSPKSATTWPRCGANASKPSRSPTSWTAQPSAAARCGISEACARGQGPAITKGFLAPPIRLLLLANLPLSGLGELASARRQVATLARAWMEMASIQTTVRQRWLR